MSLDRRHVPVVWQHVTEPARSHFLNVTQEEIGLLPGISRQVANEALKTLGARGHIKAARTGITLCALEGLLRQGE
jgi:CRP/FNR family cyclic AMP-dependent transcriptional regulator